LTLPGALEASSSIFILREDSRGSRYSATAALHLFYQIGAAVPSANQTPKVAVAAFGILRSAEARDKPFNQLVCSGGGVIGVSVQRCAGRSEDWNAGCALVVKETV